MTTHCHKSLFIVHVTTSPCILFDYICKIECAIQICITGQTIVGKGVRSDKIDKVSR